MFKILLKTPVILLAVIGLIILTDGIMPVEIKRFIYALSLTIKAVIVFILPPLIFMLLFKTISSLSRKATAIIAIILLALCCSNFLSTMVAYHVGKLVYQLDLSISLPSASNQLSPMWVFQLPKLIANDQAMLSSLVLGVLVSFVKPKVGAWLSGYFDKVVGLMMRFLTTIIPVFVLGLVVKLIHDKTLGTIVKESSLIFAIVGLSLVVYIGFLYLAASRFKWPAFLSCTKNMAPAALTGLSSMSSAAAMPFTLKAAEENVQNQGMARLAIPLTVSTHLIGDCFAIPIFAFAVMKNFGVAEPSFLSYLVFSFYFVLAKFSVAPIPAGGIIVMIPVLESTLGFTGEMSSLITAIYILFDPVITCANISGNGAFALLLGRPKYAECTLQEKT